MGTPSVLDSDIKVNLLLMQYCRTMMADIPDERMTEQPLPGVNHPAWILGHLALTAEFAAGLFGAEKSQPPQWGTLFRPGSKPEGSRSSYPSKNDLMKEFEQAFDRLRQKAATASSEQLSQPSTNPRIKDALPTVKDAAAFLLTGHVGGHLGQLSSWRRMIGMPPLF